MQAGREWEILVAQLEQLFAGPGFVVQSPENIRSARTGTIVKVDATIRGKVGSQDILIAIECRDRDHHQGVGWLQQLVTRKEDIGASELIAVSRDGFTPDAVKEAAAYKISLRTLKRFGQEDLASVLLGLTLEIQQPRYRTTKLDFASLATRKFGIELTGAAVWPSLTPELVQEILDHPDQPKFGDRRERKLLSLADLVRRSNWSAAFVSIFEGTMEYRAYLSAQYDDEFGHTVDRYELWLDEGHGVLLVSLAFIGDVWWESAEVALSSLLRYCKDDSTLATVAEFDLTPHGIPQVMQVFLGGGLDTDAAGSPI